MSRTRLLSWLVVALSVSVASPAFADSYLVYSTGGIPVASNLYLWGDCMPFCDFGDYVDCDTPEGGTSLRLMTNQWGGWGIFPQQAVDLTAFQDGDLRFFVKSPFDLTVGIDCTESSATVSYTRLISQHGWVADEPPTWQEITIPVCDLFPGGDCQPHLECLANVEAPFHVNRPDVILAREFLVDYVRWETASSHSGASSVEVQGRQLMVDGKPFVVNGMDYSPLSIGENWQGAWRDRPDRYLVDFPLIAASGANAVRLYAPILSAAMLDAAWAEGLYVIPTFGVDPTQLSCTQGRDFMRDRFVEMVEEWKDHPAILFWLVGNEVDTHLGGNDLCLDWYPQLDAMAQAAHLAEGPSFHPVATAAADVDDICLGGCSDDITLPNVDLWGTQLYRGCGFGSAFGTYAAKANCDRPLVVTEFGVDAWDSVLGAENETMQADCLESLLAEASDELAVRTPGGVSSGQVVFSWADEWWKATCGSGEWNVQDTCNSFTNPSYPDPGINEEWWGVMSQNSGDPTARGPRMAHTTVGDAWLGSVCNVQVDAYDSSSGNTTLSFEPAAGNAVDHNLYYGPLSAVSSYGYSGSVTGLGATGPSVVTLPAGSLFWVVAAENGVAKEGCYGTDSAGVERPCFSGNCDVDQISGWNCLCGSP